MTEYRNSKAVYTEVPFSFKVLTGGSFGGQDFTQDTYVNGIIDLVFKENGQWIVVDYKTYEETESSHDLHRLYEPQLNAYKDVWQTLTGEPVGDGEFFFVMKRLVG